MNRITRPILTLVASAATAAASTTVVAGVCPTGQSCFSPSGDPGCNLASCCTTICDQDPFCCDTAWDQICVGEALETCAGCGEEGAGSCVEFNGTAGCESAACCELVCDVDPFCCSNFWDAICGEEGVSLCTGCGGVISGSCWEANGTVACNDAECCEAVCAEDAFCCETQWDSVCANSALALCGGCGQPGAGPCFSPNGTPGCASTTCCTTVCAIDISCCEQAWDIGCAFQAQNVCCSTTCPGDLNHDESVDGADIGILLGDWGPGQTNCSDLNGDGGVDGADLGLLLANWGFCVQ
ncbi:MAG: hypothetical protein KDA22_14365 [Phycisphaerales bacterium]|nr:hypothetical protein [Phycisphaerales bacterium]